MSRFKSKILLESLRMPVAEIALDEDFFIREPTQDELVCFKRFGEREYILVSRIEPDRIKTLEKAYNQPDPSQEFLPAVLQRTRTELEVVLTALRLVKSGTLGYRVAMIECLEDAGLYQQGQGPISFQPDQQAWGEGEYRLDEWDLETLEAFWIDNREMLSRSDKPDRLQIAITRFEASYHKREQADKLIDLMIAMEALYLKEREGQKKYHLSHRAAVMLGSDKVDRTNVRNRLKDLYEIRSGLVHADPLITEIRAKSESDLKDMSPDQVVSILKDYVRRSIREFLVASRAVSPDEKLRELDIEVLE